MKLKMKQLEKKCIEFAERWNKSGTWDMYALVKDAYLSGYHQARKDAEEYVRERAMLLHNGFIMNDLVADEVAKVGEEKIEVEITSNQIGGKK